MSTYTLTLPCPVCGEHLVCAVNQGMRGARWTANGDGWPEEPPALEDAEGCEHVEEVWDEIAWRAWQATVVSRDDAYWRDA